MKSLFRKTAFTGSVAAIVFAVTVSVSIPAQADPSRYGQDWQAGYGHAPHAQDKDWEIMVGAGVLAKPEYEGADDYEVLPLPYIDITYKDRVMLNPRDGLRVALLKNDFLELGAGLGPDFGRDEDEDDHLRGLGDVDAAVEGELYGIYSAGRADFELAASQDMLDTGHDGALLEMSAGYAVPLPQYSLFMRPSVSTTWASDDYMDSYFGVDAGQAAASGLSGFDADSGFKNIGVDLFAGYTVTEHWSLNGLLGYSKLLGDAADSPVSESENQFSGGVFVAYEF